MWDICSWMSYSQLSYLPLLASKVPTNQHALKAAALSNVPSCIFPRPTFLSRTPFGPIVIFKSRYDAPVLMSSMVLPSDHAPVAMVFQVLYNSSLLSAFSSTLHRHTAIDFVQGLYHRSSPFSL